VAESTLSLAYIDIIREIGYAAGYGRDESQWDAGGTDLASCVAILKSALRKVYAAKDWNFFKLISGTAITTAAGTSVYTLPDSFGGAVGVMTFEAGSNKGPIVQTSEDEIRRYQQMNTANGTMRYFAIRPKGGVSGTSAGQRYEVMLWPTPDAVYTITYKSCFLADKIDGTNTYPYGGMKFGEIILEMALAEQKSKDEGEVMNEHRALAQQLIEAYWQMDKKYSTPQTLGYNSDPRTRREGVDIIRLAQYP
jgi:hypothetical protein